MAPKALLISVLVVLPGGTANQLLAALAIALVSLLAQTFYKPFVSSRLDVLNFVSLLSTLLTLFVGFVRRVTACNDV